jgi:hypothetical protein
MENNNRKFFTVTHCDVFSKTLGILLTTITGSTPFYLSVVLEDDHLEIRNAENKVEHADAQTAIYYAQEWNGQL